MTTSKINIAIDGYSGCGKSTLARDLARHLSYTYIDSGAMYRAVTLYALQHQLDVRDFDLIASHLPHIKIHFQRSADGALQTHLNGRNVESDIRSMAVSEQVSYISVIPAVRRAMVRQQQELGRDRGAVMDGRDIGTVVFPDAELKIFLTADMETRVDRRFLELQNRGKERPRTEIRKNLMTRDYIDATRSDSPLLKAPDAVTVDNSNLSPEEQMIVVLALIDHRRKRATL